MASKSNNKSKTNNKKSIQKPKKIVEAKRYDSNESLLSSISGLLQDKLGDFKDSNIKFIDSFIDDAGICILKIQGGLEGTGRWSIYLNDLKKICDTVIASTDNSVKVWLIQLEGNYIKDVFTAYFGISANIEPKVESSEE